MLLPTKTDPVSARLSALRNLPNGWKFGRGLAPSEEALRTAAALNDVALDEELTKNEIFAHVDGGVIFVVNKAGVAHEFHISQTGLISYREETEERYTEPSEVGSLDAAKAIILSLSFIWSTSSISTLKISVLNTGDSKAWLLKTPPTTQEFPSWTATARWLLVETAASMLGDFTRTLPANRLSYSPFDRLNSTRNVLLSQSPRLLATRAIET